MTERASGITGFGPIQVEGLAAPVVAATDITFGRGGEYDLTLDLYRPAGSPRGPLPAVVFIHGGGWCGGEKEGFRDQGARLASHGYLSASINYRKSFEGPFPAALEDSKCAVRWLRAHAADCSADPARIAAMGASAGAHLAAMVALTPGDFEGDGGWPHVSSAIRCAVCYCGPFDLTADATPILAEVIPQFVKPSGAEDPLLARRRASPIHHVAAGAPPFLLVHGERDSAVPIEQADRFAAHLGAAGVPFEYIRVRHGNHVFLPVDAPATDPGPDAIFARLLAFLDAHLRA